jgi:hypothetical protein
MVRTQIQLTEAQARQLRALAREQGISLAEMIRRCVDAVIGQHGPDRAALYERAEGLVGRFDDRDAATDLSRRHDEYVTEAFE